RPCPGTVRWRRNVSGGAMLLARGAPALGPEHLPPDPRKAGGAGGGGGGGGGSGGERRHLPLTLADVERQHIERALRFHGGNRTRAAQELGISRATLISKSKVYALAL